MFVVISYDVTDTKRRTRIAKALEGSGQRVQYSVFECILTPVQLQQVTARLQDLIDDAADRVRIYVLPADVLPAITILGHGQLTTLPPFYKI